jgi:hypothetical protein
LRLTLGVAEQSHSKPANDNRPLKKNLALSDIWIKRLAGQGRWRMAGDLQLRAWHDSEK